MTGLTNSSVRVVDPILTHHVQGYQSPARVGLMLFPAVPVFVSGGKVIEFNKDSFRLYNARRAPGTATKRISYGYEGKPFALTQDALEAPVPREWQRDAKAQPGIDLAKVALNVTMDAVQLALENEQAALATSAGNYDTDHKLALSGATKWSASTGVPLTDIDNAGEAIRATIGMAPNTLVLSPKAWKAARNNPQLRARVYADQPDTDRGPITLDQFKKACGIENVAVGNAMYAADNGAFADVWGNAAVLAYVAPEGAAAQPIPSYGYTYTMQGHPLVEAAYWEEQSKSWIYGVSYERAPVLTGMSAGFLITNPY